MPPKSADEQWAVEASSPVSNVQDLEALNVSTDTCLRLLMASNPATPVHLLERLAQDRDRQVRQAVASNPNTPWQSLEDLAWEFPQAFLHNSMGALQMVAHPEQIRTDSLFWDSLLRADNVPALWWHWLRTHPMLSTRPALYLHIQYIEETIHSFETLREREEQTQLMLVELATAARVQGGDQHSLTHCESALTFSQHDIKKHLHRLASSRNGEVRQAVASHTRTPRDALRLLAQDLEVSVRESVAWNVQTPVEVLRSLARDPEARVRRAVVWNARTPIDLLSALAYDSDQHVRGGIARNAQAPGKMIPIFARDTSWTVREMVAGNVHTPAEMLCMLARDEEALVRRAVACHPRTSTEILCMLAQDEEVMIREMVAGNVHTPENVLQTLIQDSSRTVRKAVAGNPNIQGDILHLLAQDHEASVRSVAAVNPQTTEEILRDLAQDHDPTVRRALLLNEQTPEETLRSLAQDRDPTVRWLAILTARLAAEAGKEQGWRKSLWSLFGGEQNLRWIGDMPIEKQVERVVSMDLAGHLREIVVEALAFGWDAARLRNSFAMKNDDEASLFNLVRIGRKHFRSLMVPFMPSGALQRLAFSPCWEVRYLVALHKRTPQETRQQLSLDGNRHVRAVATASICGHRSVESDAPESS